MIVSGVLQVLKPCPNALRTSHRRTTRNWSLSWDEKFHAQSRARVANRLLDSLLQNGEKKVEGLFSTGKVHSYNSNGQKAILEWFEDEVCPDVIPAKPKYFDKCSLFPRDDHIFHFRDQSTAQYVIELFEAARATLLSCGIPCELTRFDLHHAHAFRNHIHGSGLLFHSCEFPAYHPESFPIQLGYCQTESNVDFQQPHRNLLWLAKKPNSIFLLSLGSNSPIYSLNYPGLEPLGTLYEADLGRPFAYLIYSTDLPKDPYLLYE